MPGCLAQPARTKLEPFLNAEIPSLYVLHNLVTYNKSILLAEEHNGDIGSTELSVYLSFQTSPITTIVMINASKTVFQTLDCFNISFSFSFPSEKAPSVPSSRAISRYTKACGSNFRLILHIHKTRLF